MEKPIRTSGPSKTASAAFAISSMVAAAAAEEEM
jgi:hypothetical protein